MERDAERAAHLVTDLGSPRFDLRLDALRRMRSIHFLGGGYLNSLWPENLAMLAAARALKEVFGVPLFATGQGLLPIEPQMRDLVGAALASFDLVEARDSESAKQFGVPHGLDDAFLAFATPRSVYTCDASPDVMVLVQGDFLPDDRTEDVIRLIGDFVSVHAPNGRFGLVEALPPDDARFAGPLRERFSDAEFYPFFRLWREGIPARAGQTWLTSRFHLHLLAAAAGARGAALEIQPGYYDIKHRLLTAIKTGWNVYGIDEVEGAAIVPAGNPRFAAAREARAKKKERVARAIYG